MPEFGDGYQFGEDRSYFDGDEWYNVDRNEIWVLHW